ncbi:hypothetical protein NEUTE1DRAFT_117254, partial [Neurospora tetrasperma FGSC 2508]
MSYHVKSYNSIRANHSISPIAIIFLSPSSMQRSQLQANHPASATPGSEKKEDETCTSRRPSVPFVKTYTRLVAQEQKKWQ